MKSLKEKYQLTGVTGTVGTLECWHIKGWEEMMKKIGFKKVKAYTRGYLPFFGWVSDLLCRVIEDMENFLIAEGNEIGLEFIYKNGCPNSRDGAIFLEARRNSRGISK